MNSFLRIGGHKGYHNMQDMVKEKAIKDGERSLYIKNVRFFQGKADFLAEYP